MFSNWKTREFGMFLLFLSLLHAGLVTCSDLPIAELEFDALVKDGNALLDFKGHDELVILVGAKGSGKSTLAQFVTGGSSSLITERGNDNECIYQDESKRGDLREKNLDSLFPHLVVDTETDQMLVVNPGFLDGDQGKILHIAASFFANRVFFSAKMVKVVIIADVFSADFEESRQSFLKMLSHLAKIIPNPSELEGSIGLVVTKVNSEHSDENVITEVREYLHKTLEGHLTAEKKLLQEQARPLRKEKILESELEIIKTLLQTENSIGIFRAPCETDNECEICSDQDSLRELIFDHLQFSSTINEGKTPFHIRLSGTSSAFVTEKLLPLTESKFYQLIENFVTVELQELDKHMRSEGLDMEQKRTFIEVVAEDNEQFSTAIMIRDGLRALVKSNMRLRLTHSAVLKEMIIELDKLWFFYESLSMGLNSRFNKVGGHHLAKITASCDQWSDAFKAYEQLNIFICNVIDYKKISTFKKSVKNFASFPHFLKAMISLGLEDTSEIGVVKKSPHLVNYIQRKLKESSCLSAANEEVQIARDHVIYKGYFVKLSDVKPPSDKIKNVYILASRKVFIDASLTFTDTHVTIVSPVLEVIGARTWKMKGTDAPDHRAKSAASGGYGQPGAPGAQGLPGYSSGSLKIYTQTVLNGRNWKIHMQGGKGGRGQNGGNGHNGQNAYLKESLSHLIWCLYKRKGNNCDMSYNKVSVTVIEYYGSSRAVVDAFSRSSSRPTSGGQGGDAGPGGLPGDFVVFKEIGEDFKIKMETGSVGEVGLGGAGGQSCYTHKDRVQCELYWYSNTADNCYTHYSHCEFINYGQNGFPGSMALKTKAQNRKYLKDEGSHSDLSKILCDFAFSTIIAQCKLEELPSSKNFIEVIFKGFAHQKLSLIQLFYRFLSHSAMKKLSQERNTDMLQFLYSQFQINKNYLLKTEKLGDIVALESLILSYLDLVETYKNGRLIINVQRHLNTFKNEAEKLFAAWRDQFKKTAVDNHKRTLRSEIEMSKKFTAHTVQKNIEEAQQILQDQFDSLQEKIKEEEAKTMKNIKELRKMKEKIAGNILKKIIFGALNFAAGLISIVKPATGSVMQMGLTMGDQFSNSEVDLQSATQPVIAAVKNVRYTIAKFNQDRARNSASRSQFLLNAGEEVLRDKKLVGLLKKSTKEKLENAIATTSSADDSSPKKNKLKEVLGDCYKELKSSPAAKSVVSAKSTLSRLNVVQHTTSLTAGVISDVQRIQYDNDLLGELNAKIEESQLMMTQLDEYNTHLQSSFIPQMNEMQEAYRKFTLDAEGMAQHMLFFRRIDSKKMTREFVSLIRKFTDGFAEEQEQLINMVEDLEKLATEAMNSQMHVNELEYKLQLSSLIGTLSNNYHNCKDSKFCKMRAAAWIDVQKNTLLQKYVGLERAFQQAIFPFRSRRQFVQMPQADADEKTTISVLRERVNTMILDLEERSTTIDSNNDKYLRTAVFSSKYKSSSPFYSWHQEDHAEQIGRLLRGERVNFVADVRHVSAHNAAKFVKIGLNITAPGVPLHSLLSYLELEMVHGGDNFFRCGNSFYAIAANPLTFYQSFERGEFGHHVSQNAVSSKFAQTEIPFSPYTTWTMQLKAGRNHESEAKLKEIANYATVASLELHGSGTYVEEGAPVCNEDLPKHFDLFI